MCEFLEQGILLEELNGDQAAVTAAVARMLPAERQELRQALAGIATALGLDCASCGRIVPHREAVSVGPLGGPFLHYHPGHRPRAQARAAGSQKRQPRGPGRLGPAAPRRLTRHGPGVQPP